MSTDGRVYNFAAGPSVMPEEVLYKARDEMTNCGKTGMSVMEMSHRSGAFQEIIDSARDSLRELMNVPQTHEILFLQGGATLQFAAIPMNLYRKGSADYAVTGNFSNKAAQEAKKYLSVTTAADCGPDFRRIPAQSELKLNADADYFYYCANNTVYGTEWSYIPEVQVPLVCDMSSDILSRPVDVSKFGIIYAGAQKNMAPAGLTVVIVDKALTGREMPVTPQVMSYAEMIKTGSMLNTPPCWCIYMLKNTLDWIKKQGGIQAMEQLRGERSELLYSCLDESAFYIPHADKGSRSGMNVTFRTPSKELDAKFVKEAAEKGLVNLKGYKTVGGIRVSVYNAMPVEGVKTLVKFMKDFETQNV